jgi:hypothetical protein
LKKLYEKKSKILTKKLKNVRSLERVPVSMLAKDSPRKSKKLQKSLKTTKTRLKILPVLTREQWLS